MAYLEHFKTFTMKDIYSTSIFLLVSFILLGCSNNKEGGNTSGAQNASDSNKQKVTTDTVAISPGNNSKGVGRFKNVPLTHPLDQDMIAKAQPIYTAKCFACHKLNDEKLVGPGWHGVTDRRTPEWIMNFITNTQVMLDKDLLAESELVTCVVRMPNQNLTDEEAREMLEFMRKNDGKN
jgi:mono/diheme cytochrome c family protein